jgi:hypothetical protein
MKQRNHTSLLIYDNAEARIIGQTVGERFKLKFKYERVHKVQLTLLETDKPRLIMQADTEQIVVYEQIDG